MPVPAVSVIITAFNRERWIGQAIASICAQTLAPFEILVVDDGSTDATVERILAIGDPRLRLIRHPRNLGIPAARNTGLHAATGEFIAWLDSDDVALPDRLERQVAFLQRHPFVAMIGCCASKMNGSGKTLRGVRVPPLDHDAIRAWLLFRSAFQQSSIIGRAEILKRYPYRSEFPVCEDVDMFVRIAGEHRVANLAEVLVRRRIHGGQTVRGPQDPLVTAQCAISAEMLGSLGIDFSDDDLKRHVLLGGSFGARPAAGDLEWADDWLHRLIDANRRVLLFEPEALRRAAAFFWIRACLRCSRRSAGLRMLVRSSLGRGIASAQSRRWLGQALSLSIRGR